MLNYLLRRLLYMAIVLFLVSILSFYIVNLPPGSWIQNYALELEASGAIVDQEELDFLKVRYGLDLPLHVQYFRWVVPLVTKGDFGQSFEWGQPVWPLIEERLFLTMTISIASIIFVYVVSVPIALYSAINQYSIGDYFFSLLGPDRFGNAQLPDRACIHDHHAAGVRCDTWRTLLARVLARALEPGEVLGHADAFAGAGDRNWHSGNRWIDSHPARATAG